jgi:putative ABC transport system permease protein
VIARLPGVTQVRSTGATNACVYRSPLIPTVDTSALTVKAATLGLPATSGTSLAHGEFLNAATARERSARSALPRRSCWAPTRYTPASGSG